MTASLFDSPLHAQLFPTGETGRLFTDSAAIRAMLLVLGALARAQGARGVIPEISAAAISRAAMEVAIDPGQLAAATGADGVSLPGLVTAFRAAMEAPEHAQYVHWGATSQDIQDSALMLRLRQALTLAEADLAAILDRLAELARAHAERPMAARSFGQAAAPTSFGAQAAEWGWPLLALRRELPALRAGALWVSLSGAAGTGAALGHQAAALRADLARALRLGDPGRSWHADRGPVLRLADWFTRLTLGLGKLGEDITALAQTGIAEIDLGAAAGASSTLPQKTNPVAAAALVALGRQAAGLHSVLQGAAMPRHQRDGATLMTEWLVLPQIVLGSASAARLARRALDALAPRPARMAAGLAATQGLVHAEALSFALAERMPRPAAQEAVKSACAEARETGTPLDRIAARRWPDLDLAAIFDPARQLGAAPETARGFARAVADTAADAATGSGAEDSG